MKLRQLIEDLSGKLRKKASIPKSSTPERHHRDIQISKDRDDSAHAELQQNKPNLNIGQARTLRHQRHYSSRGIPTKVSKLQKIFPRIKFARR